MDIKMVDVMIHVDDNLENTAKDCVVEGLRHQMGVITVDNQEKTPHLIIVEYNPDMTNSKCILDSVKEKGVHAELIGL